MTTDPKRPSSAQGEDEVPMDRTLGRRSFTGVASSLAAAVGATSTLTGVSSRRPKTLEQDAGEAELFGDDAGENNELDYKQLRDTYKLRVELARANYHRGLPLHPNNGDDEQYDNKIGSDTRGLPHNERGKVDLAAYDKLLEALSKQTAEAFEEVPLGGTRKLAGPLGTRAPQ